MIREEKQKALKSVRQELLERGDELVSFRQLVERFDEVEEYFNGTPWNLEQIYSNFNILIGEKPCEDCVSRQAVLDCLKATELKKFDYILDAREQIEQLPSVNPAPKTGR